MVELEDPSKARSLGNCNVDAEPTQKRSLENGGDVSLDRHVSFKRRSVSAKRDFPPRCGRNALEGDAKLLAESLVVRAADGGSLKRDFPPRCGRNALETDAKLLAESLIVCAADGGLLRPSGVSVESELPKLSKSSDQIESSPPLLDGLKAETADLSACSNQITLLEPLNNSEPIIANQTETLEVPGGSDQTQEAMHPEKDTVQLLDISAPGEATEKNVPKKFPTRRVSCIRDFPPGCGRNAPPIVPREECQKAVISGSTKATGSRPLTEMDETVSAKNAAGKSKAKVTKQSEGEVHLESAFRHDMIEDKADEKTYGVQVKEATRKRLKGTDAVKIDENVRIIIALECISPELYAKSQSTSKKAKGEVGSLAEEEGKESGKHWKVAHPERRFKGKLVNKNAVGSRYQGEGSINSEYASDEMVVDINIAQSEKRKGEHVVDCIQRSVPKKKKNDSSSLRSSDSMEEKITKKKPRVGKYTPQQKHKEAVKDDEDSLPDDDDDCKRVPASQELSVSLIPFGPNRSGKSDDSDNASPRRKVRETLRMFQAICRKLLREEETKTNRPTQAPGRIDLTAAKLLKEGNKCVNTGAAILGPVPGIEVGDEFRFRVELAIVGLHRPYQSGIDYTKRGKTILATSVVASGGYADDIDSSDVMVYSGQGGTGGGDKQPEDQKLERGNLSLKNSMDAKTPVRVIRGFKEPNQEARGKMTSTFTYDGLYLVEKYWQEKGDHGCAVFKFQMRRLPGQPELAFKEVKKSNKSAVRQGLKIPDISHEKENIPICVVNTVDGDCPLPFKYITKMIYPSWYIPTPPRGCDCTGGCSDSNKCVCVMKNGGEIPFNYNGAIVEAKPLVYECGPSCKCPPSCHNRVSQHGIIFRLEVFKTKLRGWGVRSLTSIPSGSFICEYTGELLKDKEAEQRTGNDEYLFDIGSNFREQSLWDGFSAHVPESQSNVFEKVVEDGEYTIDAAECGNVGRFINHSCSPNLYAQNVLYDHDDNSMPHIMFFAAENIPPLQELTYHYNYTIGQVYDSNGNVKQKNCYCGSHECTGRLY